MGKNKKKRAKQDPETNLPNVSICTPTFNRRPFFEGLLKCVQAQDYPHKKIEWIIIDDGTDKIEDIFQDEKTKSMLGDITVRYFYYKDKMDLGKKRNLMHEKCTFKNDEDIIVYMDDDDYYPPERVSHSVRKLTQNKNALCGGSSELFLWFNVLDKMYKFGPYGPNHATAGTFSFKRKLLKDSSYEEDAVLAEEKHFLKNYTVPFVQFDPFKTILVVSHEQNTFDKKKLLAGNNKFVKDSSVEIKKFIEDKELRTFYESKINELLKDYEPGDVKNKPKVLKEIARREEERKKLIEAAKKEEGNKKSGIRVTDTSDPNNLKTKELTIVEVKNYLTSKTRECQHLAKECNELKQLNSILITQAQEYTNTTNAYKKLKEENDMLIQKLKDSNIS